MVSVLWVVMVGNLLFLIDFIALVGKQESFSVSFYLLDSIGYFLG